MQQAEKVMRSRADELKKREKDLEAREEELAATLEQHQSYGIQVRLALRLSSYIEYWYFGVLCT